MTQSPPLLGGKLTAWYFLAEKELSSAPKKLQSYVLLAVFNWHSVVVVVGNPEEIRNIAAELRLTLFVKVFQVCNGLTWTLTRLQAKVNHSGWLLILPAVTNQFLAVLVGAKFKFKLHYDLFEVLETGHVFWHHLLEMHLLKWLSVLSLVMGKHLFDYWLF